MRPSFADAYTLLIDAVLDRRPGIDGERRGGVYDAAAGVEISVAVYGVIAGLGALAGRLFERPRFRSAAFADRVARPSGRAV